MSAKKSKTTSTATAKKPAKPKPRETFPSPEDAKLAARANARFSGSDVSPIQLRKCRSFVNRLKTTVPEYLECTASQLKRYTDDDLALRQMPAATKKKLSKKSFDRVYDKSWPAKTAAILYELHAEQQRLAKRAARSKTPTPTETS